MTELTVGSEKQIAWAEQIRTDLLTKMDAEIEKMESGRIREWMAQQLRPCIETAREALQGCADAKKIINLRNGGWREMILDSTKATLRKEWRS